MSRRGQQVLMAEDVSEVDVEGIDHVCVKNREDQERLESGSVTCAVRHSTIETRERPYM